MPDINENILELFTKCETRMEKTISNLKSEYSIIRAGRANPHVLDKVLVNSYGAMVPLNQVGNINVTDPRCLTISVWDPQNLKVVEKAILESNIGINPVNDGKVIRLIFPIPTEERRRELVKQVKKLAEDAKVALRNLRREGMEGIKKLKSDDLLTEDDITLYEKDLDKTFNKYSEQVDTLSKDKEKDILEV